jgi:hypothetical protein
MASIADFVIALTFNRKVFIILATYAVVIVM